MLLDIFISNSDVRRSFYRGGGGSKNFDFPSSPKSLNSKIVKGPYFEKKFCAAGKFINNQAKKGAFRHFLENLDQKIALFGARFPLKNGHIGGKGAFRKFLRLFSKKRMSQSYSKGDPLEMIGNQNGEGGSLECLYQKKGTK